MKMARMKGFSLVACDPVGLIGFSFCSKLRNHGAEAFAPFILDIKRNRIGQEFFKQFRCLFRWVQRVEPILLGGTKKHPKAKNAVPDLCARKRGLFQKM